MLCAGYALKDHIRTLYSLRRIPGTKAYVMDYFVNYNMADVRAHGMDVDHIEDSLLAVFCPRWIAPIATSGSAMRTARGAARDEAQAAKLFTEATSSNGDTCVPMRGRARQASDP